MGFLLRAGFWLALVFVVMRTDFHDGHDRSALVGQVAQGGETLIRTKAADLAGPLAGQAAKACSDQPDLCMKLAKAALAQGEKPAGKALPAAPDKPSQHTLTPADLAPAFAMAADAGEPAPTPARTGTAPAFAPVNAPLTTPLPLPRRPA